MNDIAVTDQALDQALDQLSSTKIVHVPSPTPPALIPLASASVQQVCTALAIAQGQFKTPKKTKEATVKGTTDTGRSYEYKFKYAPLEEIVESVKEGLAANGLARQQYLASRGDQTVLRTIIWHCSGEWIASDYPIYPAKAGAQGFASGVTYARRYGLSLALGLAPEDDDDANLAEGQPATTSDVKPANVANGNGQSTKPVTAPLPPTPPTQPPMDQVTGEISPHQITVPLTQRGASDWIKWGGQVVAALQAARNRDEVEAWVEKQQAALKTCEGDFPKVHTRVSANIEEARKRFPDAGEREPQFMQPSDPLTAARTGSRYANVG